MKLIIFISYLVCDILTRILERWCKTPITQKTFSFWSVMRLCLLFVFLMLDNVIRTRTSKADKLEYVALYEQALKVPFLSSEDGEDVTLKGISKNNSDYYYDDVAVMHYYLGEEDVETKKEKGRTFVKSLKNKDWIEVENFTLLQLGYKLFDGYDDERIDYETYRNYIKPQYNENGLRYVNDFPYAEDLRAPIKFWDCKGVIEGKYVDTAVKLYYEGIRGHLNIVDHGDEILVMCRDDHGWIEVDRIN